MGIAICVISTYVQNGVSYRDTRRTLSQFQSLKIGLSANFIYFRNAVRCILKLPKLWKGLSGTWGRGFFKPREQLEDSVRDPIILSCIKIYKNIFFVVGGVGQCLKNPAKMLDNNSRIRFKNPASSLYRPLRIELAFLGLLIVCQI